MIPQVTVPGRVLWAGGVGDLSRWTEMAGTGASVVEQIGDVVSIRPQAGEGQGAWVVSGVGTPMTNVGVLAKIEFGTLANTIARLCVSSSLDRYADGMPYFAHSLDAGIPVPDPTPPPDPDLENPPAPGVVNSEISMWARGFIFGTNQIGNTLPATMNTDTPYWMQIERRGSNIFGMVWDPATHPEPPEIIDEFEEAAVLWGRPAVQPGRGYVQLQVTGNDGITEREVRLHEMIVYEPQTADLGVHKMVSFTDDVAGQPTGTQFAGAASTAAVMGLTRAGGIPPPEPPPTPERYFANTSPWNQTQPAGLTFTNVPLFEQEFQIMFPAYEDYSVVVAHTSAEHPYTDITVRAGWDHPAGTVRLRIPPGTQGAPGTDMHLVVIDDVGDAVVPAGVTKFTDAYYDFWVYQTFDTWAWTTGDWKIGSGWGNPGTLHAAGVRGGGSALLGGLIFPGETLNGIPHALGLGLPGSTVSCPGTGYVPPAILGDGSCEGVRFFVPSNVAMPGGLTVRGQNLFTCLKTYGAFSADTVGGGIPVYFFQTGFPEAELPTDADTMAIIPLVKRVV